MLYEYVEHTLAKEIASQRSHFREDFLWKILRESLSGLMFLAEHKISHANIRAESIFFDTGTSHIKLAEQRVFTHLSLFQQAIAGGSTNKINFNTYLSPALALVRKTTLSDRLPLTLILTFLPPPSSKGYSREQLGSYAQP